MEERFKRALAHIRCDRLEELDFYCSILGEEHLCELVKELKGNKSVKVVRMMHCRLGPRVGGVLCDVLKLNQSITKLNLYGNNLGDEGTQAIAEALKVNRNVNFLDLARNGIGQEGARALAEALKVNESMTELNLYGNEVGTEGAQAIAEAMRVNHTIDVLSVGYSDAGAEGALAILETLKVNGSLTNCFVDDFESNKMAALCKRNFLMHEQARESVVYLLALRKTGRVTAMPMEIVVMIAMALWRTKCDVDAWSKVLHENIV